MLRDSSTASRHSICPILRDSSTVSRCSILRLHSSLSHAAATVGGGSRRRVMVKGWGGWVDGRGDGATGSGRLFSLLSRQDEQEVEWRRKRGKDIHRRHLRCPYILLLLTRSSRATSNLDPAGGLLNLIRGVVLRSPWTYSSNLLEPEACRLLKPRLCGSHLLRHQSWRAEKCQGTINGLQNLLFGIYPRRSLLLKTASIINITRLLSLAPFINASCQNIDTSCQNMGSVRQRFVPHKSNHESQCLYIDDVQLSD